MDAARSTQHTDDSQILAPASRLGAARDGNHSVYHSESHVDRSCPVQWSSRRTTTVFPFVGGAGTLSQRKARVCPYH